MSNESKTPSGVFSINQFLSGLSTKNADKSKAVKIVYTNYNDETEVRNILPDRIYFGKSDFHPDEQWLLVATDLDKKAERHFAIKDIHVWF